MKPYAGIDFEEYRGLGKKKQEIAAVLGVLRSLGLSGFQIKGNDSPDALVDFSDAEGGLRLACEVRTLHNDERLSSGSELEEFNSRWVRIMERVIATLRSDGTTVPYCSVSFLNQSYSCLKGMSDQVIMSELIIAGGRLRTNAIVAFPQPDMPTLNSTLKEIRVLHADGQGLLWWPTHLKSGEVPQMATAIVEAVKAKGKIAASFDWKGAEEKLLLLVAQARGLTDIIGHAREFDIPLESSPFTWILVWDKFSLDVWTIFPGYAVICDGLKQLRRPELLPQKLRRFCTAGEQYPTRPKPR